MFKLYIQVLHSKFISRAWAFLSNQNQNKLEPEKKNLPVGFIKVALKFIIQNKW